MAGMARSSAQIGGFAFAMPRLTSSTVICMSPMRSDAPAGQRPSAVATPSSAARLASA